MQIDQTRYKQFWSNPERYRLAYQLNIVPATAGYGLQRGIVFHTAINQLARGATREHVLDVVHGRVPDYDGRLLTGNTPAAIENGLSMAEAYHRTAPTHEIIGSELEFKVDIPGSPHSLVGRLDQIIRDTTGKQRLLEFKTGSPKTQHARKVDEWDDDIQADCEILGARSLGFEPESVEIQYVLEKTPPLVWQPISVTRSEAQLKRTLLAVHQTCETIEMYCATFGLEQPWPGCKHGNWPCNGDKSYCDHKTICGTQGTLSAESLGKAWKRREEHLEILRVPMCDFGGKHTAAECKCDPYDTGDPTLNGAIQ